MHDATRILRQEHDAILRMLDVAEESARRLQHGEAVPRDVLNGLLEFLQLFADRCHHGKEEDLLFPLLEKKGLTLEGGPIGVMLHEHDLGRDLVAQMTRAAAAYNTGDKLAGRRWAEPTLQYAALLREHIHKENNILFVMAERLLTPSEQQELTLAFATVETEKMGAGTHERLHALMDQLCATMAR
jgi:hemerythrin-like domain-containing protein